MGAAEEIEKVKRERWIEANSDLAELGLIAEELGLEVDHPHRKPGFKPGDILEELRRKLPR